MPKKELMMKGLGDIPMAETCMLSNALILFTLLFMQDTEPVMRGLQMLCMQLLATKVSMMW